MRKLNKVVKKYQEIDSRIEIIDGKRERRV